MSNPIQYTSRTFQSILADINTDPELRDKPDWWKRIWAGVGDVLSIWNNAAANNAYLRTAFSRRAVVDLCRMLDYDLTPGTTSTGVLLFDLKDGASLPVTVVRRDLVGLVPGSADAGGRRFEARAQSVFSAKIVSTVSGDWNTGTDIITVPQKLYTGEKVVLTTNGTIPSPFVAGDEYYVVRVTDTSIRLAETRAAAYEGVFIGIDTAGTGNQFFNCRSRPVQVWQQELLDPVVIGESNGTDPWQEYVLGDRGILVDTVTVTINGVQWSRVPTLVNSNTSDNHFRVTYLSDQTAIVEFGDGNYGRIPPAFPIECRYAVGGGSRANVGTPGRIRQYGGGSSVIESVSNAEPMIGGGEPEGIENAKRVAPLLLKARDRFVTSEDGEVLALGYGGVSQISVIRNAFGVLTARVVGVGNGGGNPPAQLQSEIEAYLEERSVLESIDVTFNDLTITPVDVTCAAAILPGQSWSAMEERLDLAWRLVLTEAGVEIFNTFLDFGVITAIGTINGVFSTGFDNSDASWIGELLEQYRRFAPVRIGGDIRESNVIAFVKAGLTGVDFINISAPTFPIVLDEDEITTPGTITLTEVT